MKLCRGFANQSFLYTYPRLNNKSSWKFFGRESRTCNTFIFFANIKHMRINPNKIQLRAWDERSRVEILKQKDGLIKKFIIGKTCVKFQ